MAILCSQSTKYSLLMFTLDRRSDLGAFPMWLPHMALCLGFALIGLMTLWRLLEMLAARTEPEDHPSEARISA